MKLRFGIAITLIVLILRCNTAHKNDDPIPVSTKGIDSTLKICFKTDVKPIIITNCARSGCHDTISKRARLYFKDYEDIVKNFTPYNGKNSVLYLQTSSVTSSNMMPPIPYAPLTDQQRNIIKWWADQGALQNNGCQ